MDYQSGPKPPHSKGSADLIYTYAMALTLSFLWRRRKRLRHKKDKVELK